MKPSKVSNDRLDGLPERRVRKAFSQGMTNKKIRVQAYSGYRLNERPVRFSHGGKMHEIQEIMTRSEEEVLPAGERLSRFRVRCLDGKIYLLVHSRGSDQWYLVE